MAKRGRDNVGDVDGSRDCLQKEAQHQHKQKNKQKHVVDEEQAGVRAGKRTKCSEKLPPRQESRDATATADRSTTIDQGEHSGKAVNERREREKGGHRDANLQEMGPVPVPRPKDPDQVNGEGCRRSGSKGKKRRVHDEDGYEGPVDEEDSEDALQDGDDDSADGQSEGGSDEHSSSGDEIKLTGALRRGDEEYDSEQEPEEDDEEEDEEGEDQPTIVSVSLDFCDPHERFFHGIRSLAAHSFLQDAAGLELSPLVDLVVAQGAVGTVLSTDGEDDDVFGFVTAMPLRYLARDNRCAQVLIKYLLKKAAKAGRSVEMEAVLGEAATEKVGLLVSERMINCPIQAVPKLHEALVEDIAWAVQNEISDEHRDKFRFDKIVVVAPCDDTSGGKATGSGVALLSDFSFWRFDDEVLLQEADFFFSMVCAAPGEGAVTAAGGGGTASGAAGGRSGQQRYVVGVVPAAKLEDCAKEIENMVGA
ncbi:unnamed protein product [Ascophyllum nodosum]